VLKITEAGIHRGVQGTRGQADPRWGHCGGNVASLAWSEQTLRNWVSAAEAGKPNPTRRGSTAITPEQMSDYDAREALSSAAGAASATLSSHISRQYG